MGAKLSRRNTFLRKIQKVRTGSYIVSLPVEWIQQNSLKPHDPVIVVVDPNNNVAIRIPKSNCTVEVPVNGANNPLPLEILKDIIKYLIVYGANKIIIKNDNGDALDPAIVALVRDLRKDLMGFEIERISKDMIIAEVRDSIEMVDKRTMDKYVSKIMNLLTETLIDMCSCIEEPSTGKSLMIQIKERMHEAKRTYRYAHRLLFLSLREPERNGLTYVHQGIYLEVLSRLREISYYLFRISEFLENMDTTVSGKLLTDECHIVAAAMNKSDPVSIYEARVRVSELDEKVMLSKPTPPEAYVSFALRRIIHNLLIISENFITMQLSRSITCNVDELNHLDES